MGIGEWKKYDESFLSTARVNITMPRVVVLGISIWSRLRLIK